WIGFGKQCFHFSEHINNWTSSQNFCTALEGHLALFDSLEKVRYNGDSDHCFGLHREAPEHPWMDPIRGGREYTYLSDRGISSGRGYTHRKWICSLKLLFTRAMDFKY
ncbi:hypothetical protein U0070_012851, partial [Myodes glareolus]